MLQPIARKLNQSQKIRCIASRISNHKPFGSRRYTTVIMRGIPSTMMKALSMASPVEPIVISNAKAQHATYVKVLEDIVPRSVQLAADDNHPDCVFIEDTAVVIDDRAVICRIGAESRRGEVNETKESLLDLGLSVLDMRNDTENATCDGGDVLYPVSYRVCPDGMSPTKRGGHHLFVGISSRTNYEGAEYLQKAFPHVDVIPIEIRETNGKALHLKSIVTHITHRRRNTYNTRWKGMGLHLYGN
jgi:dimethylargininase